MMTLDKLDKMCRENHTHLMTVLNDKTRTVVFEKSNMDINSIEMRVFDERDVCIERTVNNDYIMYTYIQLVNALKHHCSLEGMIEQLSLDECIFVDDYDFYSDMYKDIYYVRPHMTETVWNLKVSDMRVKVYKTITGYMDFEDIMFQMMDE